MKPRANAKQLRSLLALQDRERRLLACEIHDGFVQQVVSAQIGIDNLLERLLKTDPAAVEELLRIRAAIRASVDESRALIGELRPMAIDDLDLVGSIQHVVQLASAQHKIHVQFEHDLKAVRFDPQLESTILRIVQEGLTNIVRHAQTAEAKISLQGTRGRLRLAIVDAGVGFSVKQVPGDKYGLWGIRERAKLFGGKATIRSRPGKGTQVIVELPASKMRRG